MSPARSRDDRGPQLDDLHLALSVAATLAEVAGAVTAGLRLALEASVVTICTAGTDALLHTVDVAGYPRDLLPAYATIPLSAKLPLTDAARTRRPVWLPDRVAIMSAYPVIADSLLPGTEGLVALPLVVGDRLIGALGVTFTGPLAQDVDERTFLLDVTGQVAMAVERAGLADAHLEMAETLQRSLLPGALPELDGVAVAARYLAAEVGTSAGGDWYDVLELDDGRVAVAVGDVVGHGAAAAAVMGQLRSALTALLLAGFGPARALQLLDRFAARVPGAGVATAACVIVDQETRRLTYSSAGHPPPLVVDAHGGTYLEDGNGPALGVAVSQLRREARWQIDSTSTLLLYTDGLIEGRGPDLDDGLARLALVAGGRQVVPVADLVDRVLAGLVDPIGAADDIALVAVRLLPAPLSLTAPATPAVLSRIRRAAGSWADAAGLHPDTVEDLQLALGEAAGNAAEHAYRDATDPGPVSVLARLDADGALNVVIADSGTWRPPPDDPGHRGRGLQMIRSLASDIDLAIGPDGTTIRFRMTTSPFMVPMGPTELRGSPPPQSATMITFRRDNATHVVIAGDLDHEGVAALGEALLAEADRGAPLLVDVTGLGWLTSTGVGLLLEVLQHCGGDATFLLPKGGPARRVLDLTGVTTAVLPADGADGRRAASS